MTQDSPERKSEAAVGKLIGVADGVVKASGSVSDLIPDQRR
jgi:hypothetical protein